MSFCLPKFQIDEFIKSLPKDISKLMEMSSEQRRGFFTESVGAENAKQVNALFESKLILKNQQLGLINWAENIIGIKEAAKRDFLSKVQRLDKVLQPAELKTFLEDFVEKRLGLGVTMEEAGNLTQFSKTVAEKQTPYLDSIENFKSKHKGKSEAEINQLLNMEAMDKKSELYSKRIEYGTALVEFKNYISKLKIKATEKGFVDYLKNPFRAIPALANTFKSILSTLDNSFFGRQGIKVFWNRPGVWLTNFLQSWKNIVRQVVAKNEGGLFSFQKDVVMDAIKADVYSRPRALNGDYARADLAIGILTEEAFPALWIGRIPIVGRIFKASEAAFNGGALRMRADLADRYLSQAERNGINIKDKSEAKSIGTLVNSMTGRGKLSLTEETKDIVNGMFFSVRFLKSNIDFITIHAFDKMSVFARKQAAYNLARMIFGVGATMFLANLIWPGSVDLKKKIGKIKMGGQWVDITGGVASIAQLGINIYNKLSQPKYKYGEQTALDLVENFFEGKVSPALGVLRDVFEKRTYEGKKPTLAGETRRLITPLPIQITFEQVERSDDAGDLLLTIIAEGLGFGVSPVKRK